MSDGLRPMPPLPGFRTAKELYDEEHGENERIPVATRARGVLVEGAPALVQAECDIAATRRLWNDYLAIRELILSDPACFDEIAGRKEMNRTGATRLALPFGLSIEQRGVDEGRVQLDGEDEGTWDYRYRVSVRVGKGSRFVDGIGSCRLSEIPAKTRAGEPVPISQREHFALTKAWTRAVKRAVADILGGTEAEA